MKVANMLLLTMMLSFATATKKKKRHGRSIVPRCIRYQQRTLHSCRPLFEAVKKLPMKPAPAVRKYWVHPILQDHDLFSDWVNLVPVLRMDDVKFFNYFRMTVASFDKLHQKVAPFIRKTSWRKPICTGERLAITLRYLASGESMISLSYAFRVSKQCISKIVMETCIVIWNVLKEEVMPMSKPTMEGWLLQAAEFSVMWQLQHCVGAIDGKHVGVKAFPHCGSSLFNYKKFHSMILMAIGDAKYRFTLVEFGASGRRGDGNVFKFSAPGQKLLKGLLSLPPPIPAAGFSGDLPFYFVGDAAFSGNPNIVAPKKGHFLSLADKLFNYRLSRARRVIENAFGILCARFRILNRTIDCCKTTVKVIVMACIALHNMHLRDEDSIPEHKRKYCPLGFADVEGEEGSFKYGRWRNENPEEEESQFYDLTEGVWSVGEKKRFKWNSDEVEEMLLENFVNNPLPWQWHSIHAV